VPAPARSFQIETATAARALDEIRRCFAGVTRPTAGLVFLSGGLATQVLEVAQGIAALGLRLPVVVVGGSSVLSDAGELGDASGASGLIWTGGRAELCGLAGDHPDAFGESLLRMLADRAGRTEPTVMVFAETRVFGPSALAPLRQARGTPYVLGGGATASPGVARIGPDGSVQLEATALILRGLAPPVIRTVHSCKLLSRLAPITACRGALALEIDGQPALEVLTQAGRSAGGEKLIVTMLAEARGIHDDEPRPPMLVRGVQGIDTDRGGLVLSDEIYEGMRIAFAVRDADAARSELETVLREIGRDIGGAAPRFGVYVNCSARGFELYGTPGVDTRALRSKFPGLPFAGMQSAFEIAPHAGHPTMQLYTGVFALFTALS
jgi:hypothetical protein